MWLSQWWEGGIRAQKGCQLRASQQNIGQRPLLPATIARVADVNTNPRIHLFTISCAHMLHFYRRSYAMKERVENIDIYR